MKKNRKDKERDYERLVEEESLILEATELIEELLELTDLNRKELAERLGRSKGFVTQILAGDRNMTLRTLADLAFALEHRVKVAALPLIESGNGGEAMTSHSQSMTRVYAGAGEFIAHARDKQVSDSPRRQPAAEAAASTFWANRVSTTVYSNARRGDERPDLLLLGTYEPLQASNEQEKAAR
ncbi:MAG TPA: helix-turn-helix transcriptional regulator [Solirubrobacterales bacterium]|nr:helix-turn-helix transcriptional regulator [Solirubrobacterales bacterium]